MMKPTRGLLLPLLVIAPGLLVSGCTTALWDKSTFAHYYRPADTPDLHLFYSPQRQDVLVRYNERQDSDERIHPRNYWLERNSSNIDRKQKPKFVSIKSTEALVPIPLHETFTNTPAGSLNGLHATAKRDQDLFTLCTGQDQLEHYRLPVYSGGGSQKVKQVLLTPFAVAVDATIVGAVIGYYAAPSILQGLNR